MAWYRQFLPTLALVAACNPAIAGEDTDGDTDGPTSGGPGGDPTTNPTGVGDSGETTGGEAPDGRVQLSTNQNVDILLVIDNSGSMAEEQEALAAAIGTLTENLGGANYRIAITTTDDGNYWCPGTSPEAGSFVGTSCRSRLEDFTFLDTDAQSACTNVCDIEQLDFLPTPTAEDPNPTPRPWIQSENGVLNLAGDVTVAQALRCLAPQGINGCGFESPLESMRKSIARASDTSQAEIGFMREDAVLAVLFVSDEADCSRNPDQESVVFGEAGVGNQVFWSLPDAMTPTSAVCWNAGVSCDFSSDVDQCVSVNLDVDGNPIDDEIVAEDTAALHPVSRYQTFLQAIEQAKQQFSPDQEVIVAGLLGVPDNYPQLQQIAYAEGSNPMDPGSFQAQFGIGPGCASQVAEAVPPVRLREFADFFLTSEGASNLFSVCSNDYAPALDAFTASIRDQLRPPCVPVCVADTDPVETGLQPSCSITEVRDVDGSPMEVDVPECVDGMVPNGADVCFRALTTVEEMSATCVNEGWNLEVEIIRTPAAPAGGVSVQADCELSQNTAIDCPGLQG